ncbi:hypothetical protein J2S43_006254 [Catenuloplanes nepalensis]|uniref:DUF4245 domain-containing protein n=1 Tax=Catenuloplanes nepalensis TaxID=587533 RepID=A0ABT9N210_9ACTN|nr:DUF4245 domain-containing protein [Catenuloplanes nepalensis]MDP9797742.1 hypothetical protein [Catenuloplanes nepalensis]
MDADQNSSSPAEPAPAPAAAAAPAAAPAAVAPAAPAARRERNWKDMVLSLAAIMVPLALMVGYYQFFLDGADPIARDTAPSIQSARASGAFPVLAPAGLSEDWSPTTSSFGTVEGGKSLRIGYVSPSGGAVLLVESSVPAEVLLPAELTTSARPGEQLTIDGQQWQSYSARAAETALVLLTPDRTIVIVGTAEDAELRELADSLA